jgi:hypothetical protein
MDEACGTYVGEKFRAGFLVRNPKGKRPLERPRYERKENMGVKEVVWQVVGN